MAIFNRKQKVHLMFLGIMIFVGGIVETLGVSAMLPVISVILDQESLQSYEIVGTVMDILHIENMQAFTMFLLAMLIAVYVLKNLYTVWPDFICRPPFLAPGLFWWAWTMVASRESSWGSASRLSTRKILSSMPSSIHLRKRLYTEFQDP